MKFTPITDWDKVDYMVHDRVTAKRLGCSHWAVKRQRLLRGWPAPIFWTRQRIWWHTVPDWSMSNPEIRDATGKTLQQIWYYRKKVHKDRMKYARARKPLVVPTEPHVGS